MEEIRIKENARNQQEQRELEMVRIRAQGQNNTDQNIEHNGGGRDRRKFVIEIGKWNHEVTDLNTFLCNFETCYSVSSDWRDESTGINPVS